ncbi:MAG: hypothetical protein BWY99_01617 [Synergistetes bacterium ADurb.BinA166]|nr:MAG: hypothetical protein BWY99_01617 [Synergistetes bacterium ADurb.BinA166]
MERISTVDPGPDTFELWMWKPTPNPGSTAARPWAPWPAAVIAALMAVMTCTAVERPDRSAVMVAFPFSLNERRLETGPRGISEKS